jgi:hypothetical protein
MTDRVAEQFADHQGHVAYDRVEDARGDQVSREAPSCDGHACGRGGQEDDARSPVTAPGERNHCDRECPSQQAGKPERTAECRPGAASPGDERFADAVQPIS